MKKCSPAIALAVFSILTIGLSTFGATSVLVVSPESDDFQTIQDAVDAACIGDVILVLPGVYHENLYVDQTLTLMGCEGATLVPEEATQAVVSVNAADNVVIHGFQIDLAGVGIEMLGSSGLISDCSIVASKLGVDILTFGDSVMEIHSVAIRGGSSAIGVRLLGSGTTNLTDCVLEELGTGIMIGGSVAASLIGCILESNSVGLSILNTAIATLSRNTIQGNYIAGIQFSRHPQADIEGALILVENNILSNGSWGITQCGIDNTLPNQPFGNILGVGNSLAGNGLGDICPAGTPLPEGFYSVSASDN